MSATEFTGSWFPSGFFGHNRSRWRNDFLNHYRQLARPQPPDLFLKRLNEYRTKNVNPFSEHDTKQSREFINVSFEQPVKASARASKTERSGSRDVIAWTHGKDEGSSGRTFAEAYHDSEKTRMQSSYSTTYNSLQPKLLAARPITAYEQRPWTSSYRHAFCNNEPVPDAMGKAIFMRPTPPQAARSGSSSLAKSASISDLSSVFNNNNKRLKEAESVSSCLVWCDSAPASHSTLRREQMSANTIGKQNSTVSNVPVSAADDGAA